MKEYEREAIIEEGKQKKISGQKQYTFINQNISDHDRLVKEKEK